MDNDTKHKMQGIFTQTSQVLADLFQLSMMGTFPARRIADIADSLEALAVRVRRLGAEG